MIHTNVIKIVEKHKYVGDLNNNNNIATNK